MPTARTKKPKLLRSAGADNFLASSIPANRADNSQARERKNGFPRDRGGEYLCGESCGGVQCDDEGCRAGTPSTFLLAVSSTADSCPPVRGWLIRTPSRGTRSHHAEAAAER